jgi:hypothetical protein
MIVSSLRSSSLSRGRGGRVMKGWVLTMNKCCCWHLTEMILVHEIGGQFTETALSRLKGLTKTTAARTRVILWIVWHALLLVMRFEHSTIGPIGFTKEVDPTCAIKRISGSWETMFEEASLDNRHDVIGRRVSREGVGWDDNGLPFKVSAWTILIQHQVEDVTRFLDAQVMEQDMVSELRGAGGEEEVDAFDRFV